MPRSRISVWSVNRRVKMSRTARDFSGTIGGFEVLYRDMSNPRVRTNWICRCIACGKILCVQSSHLRPDRRGCRSCTTTQHGMSHTSLHNIWMAMRQRCQNTKSQGYQWYGARGIHVCARWNIFTNFVEDMGIPQPGQSIERIHNDGDYEPSNCKWADRKEQSRNHRGNRVLEAFGQAMCIASWAEAYGLKPRILYHRLNRDKLTLEQALLKPVRRSPRKTNSNIVSIVF